MAPVDTFNAELAGDESVLKKDVKSMYKLGRKLGKGAYAVVHRGTLLSDKSITRAVKIIDERALGHEDIEALQRELTKMMGVPVQVNIQEIAQPDLDATLVAEGIASQLEKRVMFRRAMKRAVQNSMRSGAQGIKVELSGRLGGAEIARTEWYREGRVPLHTLRADIDYASIRAETTYGTIGVKVWVFRGEILDGMASAHNPPAETKQPAKRPRRERRDRRSEA